MTLEGAMTGDMQYINKGLLAILPDDDARRPVFFFNRTHCVPPDIPRDAVVSS